MALPFVCCLVWFLMGTTNGLTQSVEVTLRLDTNVVDLGQSTMLRVYAQVVPDLETNANRIFSWYVDVMNSHNNVAAADYEAMTKLASDNFPTTSSTGSNEGGNRVGIRDTFFDLPGAGVGEAVELMAIPVTGQSAGMARFTVGPGSGVPELFYDFQVAPLQGGDAFVGGDYADAFVDLQVGLACAIRLHIERVNGGGPGEPLNLTFDPCAGYDHSV